MKRLFFASPICLLFLLACKDKPGYVSKQENNGDAVYSVEKEDVAMNGAIATARSTYSDFLKALHAKDSASDYFIVKCRFAFVGEDGERSFEHMWIQDLYYQGSQLHGVLSSDPINIHWTKAGDSLEIKTDSVTDWMYVRNGRLVGGYTLRVLYDKMTEDEKKAFSSKIPYKID